MRLWKSRHNFLSSPYKVRQPSDLDVKFMFKFDPFGGRQEAYIPHKGSQTQLAQGGGGTANFNDDDDDFD